MLEIRSGGTDQLQNAFTASILPLLTTIRLTRTGRAVLERIETSPRLVRIVPYNIRRPQNPFDDAVATPRNEHHAGTLGAGPAAAGADSEIEFSPNNVRGRGVQGRADEMLMHELCHSLRQIRGVERYQRRPGGGLDPLRMAGGFDNVEEFFAAVVTSVYSSELGRRPLGNHGSASIRDPAVLTGRPFSTRLAEFRQRMPDLVAEIAAIPPDVALFNPFR